MFLLDSLWLDWDWFASSFLFELSGSFAGVAFGACAFIVESYRGFLTEVGLLLGFLLARFFSGLVSMSCFD